MTEERMRGRVTAWKFPNESGGGDYGFVVSSGKTYFVHRRGIKDRPSHGYLEVGATVEFVPLPSTGGLTKVGKTKYPLARDVRTVIPADRSQYLPGETPGIVSSEESFKASMGMGKFEDQFD